MQLSSHIYIAAVCIERHLNN